MAKLPKITFILGTGRSGTTLLRVMLDGHDKLFSPPEMFLAIHDDAHPTTPSSDQRYMATVWAACGRIAYKRPSIYSAENSLIFSHGCPPELARSL